MRFTGHLVAPALLGLATATVLLAACSPGPERSPGTGPSEPSATSGPSAGASSPAPTTGAGRTPGAATAELQVVVVRSPGGPEQRWTLRCSGADVLLGSTHPTAAAACALIAARPEVLAPPPRDQLCTQQYGGPEVATVTGTVNGARVDRRFTRTDGCGISAWAIATPLLGAPGGAV
ncbi:Subtilisin inhibitor-like protein [Sinomonas atrocyanea]|uniref:Subtilisin inhibitor-like protein n=1 Tax=Sinomonas atrocyanea TaxID=37927 RepID=A0A126ZXC7_9MICC|nr:hypothetical protein [Sinomonas atrocyanea]AMM31211.1 Subtilisin inhibitor-like protein [Sinomonas atrocyanea]GEB64125.1 hypothetical protein SAT01_15730 [Sinomonas atrocyanea]GGG70006.1 hypothetical protein GCM10007172_22750 [Sinomonas atrocyanea]